MADRQVGVRYFHKGIPKTVVGYDKCLQRKQEAESASARGDLTRAISLLRENLIWCKTNLTVNPMHEMTVWHQEALATHLAEQGNYTEALVHIGEAYDSRHEVSPDSQDTLITLDQYASVLAKLGKHGLAARKYEAVWEGQKKALGKNHPLTLTTGFELACCWFNHGMSGVQKLQNLRKARDLHKDILAAREKESPPDVVATAMTREELAQDHLELGNFDAARKLVEKNLDELRPWRKLKSKFTAEEISSLEQSSRSLLDSINLRDGSTQPRRKEDEREERVRQLREELARERERQRHREQRDQREREDRERQLREELVEQQRQQEEREQREQSERELADQRLWERILRDQAVGMSEYQDRRDHTNNGQTIAEDVDAWWQAQPPRSNFASQPEDQVREQEQRQIEQALEESLDQERKRRAKEEQERQVQRRRELEIQEQARLRLQKQEEEKKKLMEQKELEKRELEIREKAREEREKRKRQELRALARQKQEEKVRASRELEIQEQAKRRLERMQMRDVGRRTRGEKEPHGQGGPEKERETPDRESEASSPTISTPAINVTEPPPMTEQPNGTTLHVANEHGNLGSLKGQISRSASTSKLSSTTKPTGPTSNTLASDEAQVERRRSDPSINQRASSSRRPVVSTPSQNQHDSPFDAVEERLEDRSVDQWFRDVQAINQVILDPFRRRAGKRVKIAILDTGIDLGNTAFKDKEIRKRIKKRVDFVEKDSDATDICGHGTHCVAVLNRVAPWADIYVGRVAIGFEKGPDANVVAEAIRRALGPKGEGDAADNWDVDILSLSLGFSGYNRAIKAALDEVIGRGNGKIVLAAASNTGTLRKMAFPASALQIIAVNSATAHGTPSTFNPPSHKDEKRLTFLGEAVTSAWITTAEDPSTGQRIITSPDATKRMTGTSVATPIAAGILALLLEVVMIDVPDEEDTMKILEEVRPWLRGYEGIMAVLMDKAAPTPGGYHNIVPQRLLDPTWPEERRINRIANRLRDILTDHFGDLREGP